MLKSFSTSQWFRQIFGFEESILNVYKYLSITKTANDSTKIVSSKNNASYSSGQLEIDNISFLEKSASNLISKSKSKASRLGKLNIIHGLGFKSSPKSMQYVDVMSCCSHPPFNGATIQVASNFNCLEFESENQRKSDGVTIYAYDYTQGPTASISCAAALVYRNYFYQNKNFDVRFDSTNDCNDFSKHSILNEEINLLSKTPLCVDHGKVMIKNRKEMNRLKSLNFDWKNLDNYFIANHRNCEVCLKRSDNFINDNQLQLFHNKKHFVNQVFASAFDFSSNVIFSPFTEEIARNLLYAEYKATILAAIKNSISFPNEEGSSKCFLTLLGGGVFANPPKIVAPSIAQNADLIAESGIDVNVVCFNDESFSSNFPLLEKAMKLTGGRIITTKDDF